MKDSGMPEVALFAFIIAIYNHRLENEVLLSRVSGFCMSCYAGMFRLIFWEAVEFCN